MATLEMSPVNNEQLQRTKSYDPRFEIADTIFILEKSLTKLKAEIKDLEKRIQENKDKNTAVEEQRNFEEWPIEKLRGEIKKKNEGKTGYEGEIEKQKDKIKEEALLSKLDDLLQLKEEIKQMEKRLKALEEKNRKLQELNEMIEQVRKSAQSLEEEMNSIKQQFSELSQNKETLQALEVEIGELQKEEESKNGESLLKDYEAKITEINQLKRKIKPIEIKEKFLGKMQSSIYDKLREEDIKNELVKWLAATQESEPQTALQEMLHTVLMSKFQTGLEKLQRKQTEKSAGVQESDFEATLDEIFEKVKEKLFAKTSEEISDTKSDIKCKTELEDITIKAINWLVVNISKHLEEVKNEKYRIVQPEETKISLLVEESRKILDRVLEVGVERKKWQAQIDEKVEKKRISS